MKLVKGLSEADHPYPGDYQHDITMLPVDQLKCSIFGKMQDASNVEVDEVLDLQFYGHDVSCIATVTNISKSFRL
jgi:hypothetical protein